MERKKILFLTSGATPYRRAFFEALSEYADVTVLYELEHSHEREWVVQKKEKSGLTEIVLPSVKEFTNCAFCPAVAKYLGGNYDFIIVGGYSTPTGLFSILWLKLHRKKFVLNTDGGIISRKERLINRYIKRFFISSADAWLSTGKQTDEYLSYYGADATRIRRYPFTSVWKSAILKEVLNKAEKKEFKRLLGIKETEMILSVGQFIPRKGVDILIKACAGLPDDVGVYIVGGIPTEEYIALKKKLNLNNIHFIKFMQKEELDKYYFAADLFVLATREDIWGLVINEALSKGLPVVTTNKCVAGVELITEGENGYIVPTEDETALLEAMSNIINNPILQRKMSAAAIESMSMYSFEEMAAVHMKALDELRCEGIL